MHLEKKKLWNEYSKLPLKRKIRSLAYQSRDDFVLFSSGYRTRGDLFPQSFTLTKTLFLCLMNSAIVC